MPTGWAPLLITRRARPADPRASRSALTLADRHRLRPAAGAARQPPGSVDDAEGHGRLDRRRAAARCSCARGWSTAQVALSFLLLFGAGLFVRSLQNLQTTDTGVALDNLVTFQLSPALSGYDDQRAVTLLPAAARAACASAPGVQVGGAGRRADPRRRRVGQHDVGRRAQGRGRRGHAGVHERAVARLLRDDEDSDPRRPRLPGRRTLKERHARSRSSTAASPSTSSRARARSASTSAAAPARRRSSTSRSSASSPTRSTKGRAKACGGRCSCRTAGKNSAVVLRAHARARRPARTAWCATR